MLQGGSHESAVMAGMALHAEKGLRRREQRVVGGAVCSMTVGAVLHHISMLENEGSLFIHMAARAGFLLGQSRQHLVLGCSVGIMAVRACDLAFRHGMVGKLGELHLDILVAVETEFVHPLMGDLLLRSLVKLMAIGTADIAAGVRAGTPELESGG